jgi:hypothetical protein
MVTQYLPYIICSFTLWMLYFFKIGLIFSLPILNCRVALGLSFDPVKMALVPIQNPLLQRLSTVASVCSVCLRLLDHLLELCITMIVNLSDNW